MSEPTREERIEVASGWLGGDLGWAESVLDAAGLDSLLAERDRLREAFQAAQWLITCQRDVIRRVPVRGLDEAYAGYFRACLALGELVPEDGNER